MSDCHDNFLEFNRSISLTKDETNRLRRSRNAVTSRIKRYFYQKGYHQPLFKGQGSFTMGTIIRPKSGFFDLDIGVYLKGLKGDPKEWPRTETIHKLIINAVRGHTRLRPIDKTSCIRLIYKSPYIGIDNLSYHLDIPVYGFKEATIFSSGGTVIGFKGTRQWSEYSDPQKFKKWFLEQCRNNSNDRNQLKRIVKYLKAWVDNQGKSPKMPSGMVLTVLAAKNFVEHNRDDIALISTVEEFYHRIKWLFRVERPVEPFNDLVNEMSRIQKRNFLYKIESLIADGYNAIETKNKKEALTIWERQLGKNFNKQIITPSLKSNNKI